MNLWGHHFSQNANQTSSKGISNSKCDVGNWKIHMCDIFKILGIFLDFFGNSMGILWKFFGNSLGIYFICLFFYILFFIFYFFIFYFLYFIFYFLYFIFLYFIFLYFIFWMTLAEINMIFESESDLVLLSRFCLKEEGRRRARI